MGSEERLITVCAECKTACCWHGLFMCDKAKFANITKLPISELIKLDLEHSDYWEYENCEKLLSAIPFERD